MRRRFKGPKFLVFFFLAVAGLAVFSTIVLLLWNALMPDIFHLPVIGFRQAAGLLILAKILFGGFRGGWGGGFGGRWRHKMQQRWMEMTPEERERFKQEWGRHGAPFGRGFGEGRPSGPGQGGYAQDGPAQGGPGQP
jgi:hypothetical protein